MCNTDVIVPAARPEVEPAGSGVTTVAAIPTDADARRAAAENLHEVPGDATFQNEKLRGELNQAREENTRLQQQLKALGDRHEHLNASTTHTQAELKTFQSERSQLKGEIASLRQRLAAAEESIAARESDLHEAARQIETAAAWRVTAENTQSALEETTAALGEWKAKSESADNDLAALQQSGAELGNALAAEVARRESAEAGLESAKEQAAELDRELAAARARGDETESALREAQEQNDRAEQQIAEQREQLGQAEAANRDLAGQNEALRREVEILRHDLQESQAGREIIDIRRQIDEGAAEKLLLTQRLETTGAELRALQETEAAVRAERDEARRQHAESVAESVALRESRTVKDNDVLRGIVARLNSDLVQRAAEVVRLRRSRYAVKLACVVFAIGLLGVVAFALMVLPAALRH